MKDQLEKFVNENRDAFDRRTPAERNWEEISKALFGTGKTVLFNSLTFWRIAAFLMLGLSTYLFVTRNNPQVMPGKLSTQQQDFKDIESFYSAQILEKVALISTEDVFADESFTQDIEKLEAMYSMLSEEMKRHPSDKVKDAMVLNMLVRIDLLNQQIQKLEDRKKKPDTTSI
jgi:hypothetical protein